MTKSLNKSIKFVICVFFSACSCSTKKDSDNTLLTQDPAKYSANNVNSNDSCLKKQKLFLSWYLSNYEQINSSRNIISYPRILLTDSDAKETSVSSTKYYQFNSNNLNTYLDELKKTGYFSDVFIENKRIDMIKRGKLLDAEKQEDGPPEGFDFDEVFHTQEMYSAEDINKLRFDSTNENAVILPIMEGFSWILYLKNTGKECLVDSISSR